MASGGKEECGECKATVSSRDKGVQCEICEVWYHAKCEGVSEDTYKYLQKGQGVHWYCKACDKGVAKLLTAITNLQRKQDKLELDIKLVAEDMAKIKNEMHEDKQNLQKRIEGEVKGILTNMKKMEDHIDERVRRLVKEEVLHKRDDVKAQIDESLKQVMVGKGEGTLWSELVTRQKEICKDVVLKEVEDKFMVMNADFGVVQKTIEETRDKITEETDRLNRRNNVIIYNMIESTATTLNDRSKDDKENCKDLMLNVLQVGCEEGEIKKAIRLGKRLESGKPRPLLVEFCDGHVKNLTMEHASRLSHASGKFEGVTISHDMTVKEREQCRKLVAEAKQMQNEDDSGEYIYKVRGLPGQMKIMKFKKIY